MAVSFGSLLPALSKLGGYFKEGMDHYVTLKASGVELDADTLAFFITEKMSGWDPKVKGKPILDPETIAAAARFLAGAIINLTAGQNA